MKNESILDATFEDHGSIWLIDPITPAAKTWLDDNITGHMDWFAGSLAVEPRFVWELIEGMQADGLEIGSP
jgi:hypothetical protein